MASSATVGRSVGSGSRQASTVVAKAAGLRRCERTDSDLMLQLLVVVLVVLAPKRKLAGRGLEQHHAYAPHVKKYGGQLKVTSKL